MTTLLNLLHPFLARLDNNMNMPPNPPSSADEDARKRNSVHARNRLVRHMKHRFPGLPF